MGVHPPITLDEALSMHSPSYLHTCNIKISLVGDTHPSHTRCSLDVTFSCPIPSRRQLVGTFSSLFLEWWQSPLK